MKNLGYYFESDDRKHQQALDLLMLTQGWSRYVWKEMTGIDPLKMEHPVEKGLYIEGTVKSLFSQQTKTGCEYTDVSHKR
ncbi:MAG: hypothetical protein QM751_15735 [Paludibacteraceae bacterium]